MIVSIWVEASDYYDAKYSNHVGKENGKQLSHEEIKTRSRLRLLNWRDWSERVKWSSHQSPRLPWVKRKTGIAFRCYRTCCRRPLRLGRDGRDNQPIRKPVDTLSIRAHPAVVFACARQRSRPSINTWMSQWIQISLGWAWKRGWPSL
jgi:hypothetical protein